MSATGIDWTAKLTIKELAYHLGRSDRYVKHMKAVGFPMPGGEAMLNEAVEFLRVHAHPCSEARPAAAPNSRPG